MTPALDFSEWLIDPPDLSADDIASMISNALQAVGAREGTHARAQVTGWLNAACRHLVAETLAFARTLDADELLRGLLLAHEALRICHAGLRLAARGDITSTQLTREAQERLPFAAPHSISLRLAIEMHSA